MIERFILSNVDVDFDVDVDVEVWDRSLDFVFKFSFETTNEIPEIDAWNLKRTDYLLFDGIYPFHFKQSLNYANCKRQELNGSCLMSMHEHYEPQF